MSIGALHCPIPANINPRAAKCLITARYADVKVDTIEGFKIANNTKEPSYLAKFPLGQAPAFESKDGKFLLTESDAIAHYFASYKEESLLGKTKEEKAEIQNNFILDF